MSRPLPGQTGHHCPLVEPLEERSLLSGTASLTSGTLRIYGSVGDDTIIIVRREDVFVVNETKEFSVEEVTRLEVHGGHGNDLIEFDGAIYGKRSNLAVWLTGGDGDDTILGGSGSDRIDGGDGNDWIDGRAGNDQINGGRGDDHIWGSEGADRLIGGAGNDALFGGEGADFLSGDSGRDVLQGSAGRDSYRDDFDSEQPFAYEPSALDVQQGSGGTCSILATLSAAATAGVDLASNITYRGDNIYRVKVYDSWMWGLFHRARHVDVHFDGTWFDHDALPPRERDASGSPIGAVSGSYWATLYQRAVLQLRGVDWKDPQAVEEWAASEASAHSAILGDRDWNRISKSDAALASELRTALQTGEVVTAGTPSYGNDATGQEIVEQNGIISLHAYAVLDVYRRDGGWRVTVYNPWGWDGISEAADGLDDGIVDMDWETFVNQFEVYTRTVP